MIFFPDTYIFIYSFIFHRQFPCFSFIVHPMIILSIFFIMWFHSLLIFLTKGTHNGVCKMCTFQMKASKFTHNPSYCKSISSSKLNIFHLFLLIGNYCYIKSSLNVWYLITMHFLIIDYSVIYWIMCLSF